jgi:hypothetical protein
MIKKKLISLDIPRIDKDDSKSTKSKENSIIFYPYKNPFIFMIAETKILQDLH